MKRINSCGSVTDLYSRHINFLSNSKKPFKIKPIALACITVFSSLPAYASLPVNFSLDNITEEQKMAIEVIDDKDTGSHLWSIGGTIDLSQFNDDMEHFSDDDNNSSDLIGFFRAQKGEDLPDGANYEDARIDINRTHSNNWIFIRDFDQTNTKGQQLTKEQIQNSKDSNFNAIIHLYNGENNDEWNVTYDFSQDGQKDGKPQSTDTSVLSFFDPHEMTSDREQGVNSLKFYIFHPKVNLISQNQLVSVNNTGRSDADIGLSLSNKRKNITFNMHRIIIIIRMNNYYSFLL